LIYANARYLDPDTGRFLSFDPFEGYDDKPVSLNKYLYAYQNPLKYTDPDGKCAEPLTFTLCAIGVTTLAATSYDYFTTDRREQAYAEIRPESIGTGVLTEAYAFSQSAANTLTGGYFDAVRSNTVKEHTLENVLPVDAAEKAYTEFTREGGDPVLASLYTAKALGQTAGLGLVAAGVKSPGTARPQTVVESATTVETKAVAQVDGTVVSRAVSTETEVAAGVSLTQRGTGGQGYRVNDSGSHGELSPASNRAPGNTNVASDGRVQSHHPIQQKWAKQNVPGYNPNEAPTILLKTGKGDPHALINGMQRRSANGVGNTLRQEFDRGYRQMIDAGVDPKAAQRVMKKNYQYFEGLGAPLN
ncbi:MAG: hypothetical protein LRY72_12575, partial [Saccharospirillaceae bacterium]|nr:hypothetical protein [Saccharospirillaceae bacterium]